MEEALRSIAICFWVSLFISAVCAVWLLAVTRHRERIWLRFTAAEAAFYSRIGFSVKFVERSRRMSESRWFVFLVGSLFALSMAETVFVAHGYLHRRPVVLGMHFYQIGRDRYQTNDFIGAITNLNKSLQYQPAYPKAYNFRAAAKLELGAYPNAIADYNKAIELNPDFVSAYCGRGLAKCYSGDYVGAIADCNKGISINPKYANAYNIRGMAEGNLKKYKDAIADFDQTIQLNPKAANAFNNRGYFKIELKDFSGALADYDKAIELSPDYYMAYNNRGNLKRHLKNYLGAVADYDKAIQIIPTYEAAISNRNATLKLSEAVKTRK